MDSGERRVERPEDRRAVDPRDVVLGVAVVGARVTATAVRVALLPARLALRTPFVRLGARRLAEEGEAGRHRGRAQLETIGDELLAGPEVDALGRSLAQHHVVERVARPVVGATDVEALVEEALESRLTAQVTDRVLASPELERVVEQVAASDAVRAALAQQTTSFAGETADGVRSRARRADDGAERAVHRWLRRRVGDTQGTAGLATRGIALAVDAAVVNLLVLVAAGLIALVTTLVGELRPQWLVTLLVGFGWMLAVAVYFVLFWSTGGQTPGMRLMRLRVVAPDGRPPRAGRGLVRLVGLLLAIVPLFAGFLPVLFDDRRRGLHDFIAGTVVLYDD